MRFWDITALAAQALRAHVLRTSLTILGVIIGVTSVIAIVSIIEGFDRKIADLMNSMGTASFLVSKIGMPTSEEEFFKALKRKDLSMADLRAIQEECESCYKVGARVTTSKQVKYGKEKLNDVGIAGGTPQFIEITEFEIGEGRVHSDFEEDHSRQVVLLGASVKEEFFGDGDPIGRRVKIGGYNYDVIGVSKPRGAILGADLDKFALIPLNTFRKHFGTNRTLDLLVSARSTDEVQTAMDEVRMILRTRRHVPYAEEDDFSIITSEGMMALYDQVTKAVRAMAIGIPAIALVVAGIVVMNIMMVSVTERTREIGIRKSLGARRKSILFQFILEALLMSMGGGLVGIALGLTLAKVLTDAGDLPFVISFVAIGSGIFVSTGIGVIFGLYPAVRGSKLDPVEAMRYET
jgi:putative ABC transport system permease protein